MFRVRIMARYPEVPDSKPKLGVLLSAALPKSMSSPTAPPRAIPHLAQLCIASILYGYECISSDLRQENVGAIETYHALSILRLYGSSGSCHARHATSWYLVNGNVRVTPVASHALHRDACSGIWNATQ